MRKISKHSYTLKFTKNTYILRFGQTPARPALPRSLRGFDVDAIPEPKRASVFSPLESRFVEAARSDPARDALRASTRHSRRARAPKKDQKSH